MTSNLQQLSALRRSPFPGSPTVRSRNMSESSISNDMDVKTYLIRNPKVFDSFVMEYVAEERLEKLLKQKRERQNIPGIPEPCLPLQSSYLRSSVRDIAGDISSENKDDVIHSNIEEVAQVVARTVNANHFTIYIPIQNEKELAIYRNGKIIPCGPVGPKLTVAAHAVYEKKTIIVDDLKMDPRFPKGISPNGINDCGVLCVPVVLPTDDTIAVLEFTRDHFKPRFSQADLQLVNTVVGWMSACIHEHSMNRILHTQQRLNDFLLETTKDIFDEMTSIDTVVKKIMTFTKDLVKADRCSLFLVDKENNELYAQYFDIGANNDSNHSLVEKGSKIRFQTDKGIAGFVAKTGESVNIYDAYTDPRFNPEVDRSTGYRTRNILCMPIISKNSVYGVVEMINSLKGDHFTHADERAFQMFAVYCALALHYSRVYGLMQQQQNQLQVAVEVLQYHSACTEEEVSDLMINQHIPEDQIPADICSFEFCAYSNLEVLPQLFIYMVRDMFGNRTFESEKLCRFVLTVKKNYRPVTYHNWEHGFHVGHSLWCMINNSPGVFSKFEKMALVISGICHDIDHRGYNNAFFTKLQLPLAGLYSTSVMEQHHYKQAVTILQTQSQDIFSFLDADEYKIMLELIRHHIIATDLALYFGNQKFIAGVLESGELDLGKEDLRLRTKALMMTAADLCAVSKPWSTQEQTVDKLYGEFYMQGDEEKKRGLTPLPMMDRNTKHEQPKQQIGFLDFICLPLYSTLIQILPGTKPLLDGCQENKIKWTELAKASSDSQEERSK